MIKRILVATDGSEAAQRGLDYAMSLASALKARLTAIYVVDIKLLEGPFLRDLNATMGTAPVLNFQDTIATLLNDRGKAALENFQSACTAQGIEADTVLETGVVHHSILEQAELADLLVLGRGGEHSDWLEGLMGSTTEAVIRRAKLPVAVTGCTKPITDGILLAYDGSPHASQALKVAVQLASDTKAPLKLLLVGGEECKAAAAEAQSYLNDHAISATLEFRDGESAAKIVEYAQDVGAGLLVIGAYGHTRVRELLVGSTTTQVVNHAPCPVLLCR